MCMLSVCIGLFDLWRMLGILRMRLRLLGSVYETSVLKLVFRLCRNVRYWRLEILRLLVIVVVLVMVLLRLWLRLSGLGFDTIPWGRFRASGV